MMMRSGSNQARSAIRFVRFPAVAAGTNGGIEISFMGRTLAWRRTKAEEGSLAP